jgi:hypothetical protein
MTLNQAPHHTAASWGSYWSNHHDLPDKILASARGEVDESGDEEELPITKKSRPNYKEVTTSEDEEQEQYDDDSDSSTEPVRLYSESDMGERNSLFTEADIYFIAKYVAATTDWATMTFKDRWEPFHAKVRPLSANFD